MDKVIKDAEEQSYEQLKKREVVEKEVRVFQVGDRIVGIKNTKNGGYGIQGVCGTITNILILSSYDYIVKFDSEISDTCDSLFVHSDEIRLIK